MVLSKKHLSGNASVHGEPILVSGINDAAAVTIHTAQSGTGATTDGFADQMDKVWLYAFNTSGTDVLLTIEFGGTSTQHLIAVTVPHQAGPVLVIPGLPLRGGKVVKAFAATINVVAVFGEVDRIT